MSASLTPRGRLFLRMGAVVISGLVIIVGRRFGGAALAAVEGGPLSPRLIAALGAFALAGSIGVALSAWSLAAPDRFATWAQARAEEASRLPIWVRWIVCAICWLAASFTLLYPEGHLLHDTPTRLLLALGGSLVASLFLPVRADLPARVGLGLMATASAFAAVKKLILVTDYPFATGWSEGNRLWDYSLYFGQNRFLTEGPFTYPSYLTPGRHGLWGLVFLWPGVTIFAARLWDALLWILPAAGLGYVLARKGWTNRYGVAAGAAFGLWAFLFLSQGPIYAPLILSAVFLAWGYDPRRRWRTAAVVAGACFYAGISRWTWLVAPALWGAVWALLDSDRNQTLARRLTWPIGLGLAGGFGAALSQIFMALAFPQPSAPFATAASQGLLWYRLLPNPTNTTGILLGLVIAVGPVVGLGLLAMRTGQRPDRWSQAGMLAGMTAFLAVGLAASVKIGGGSNLHNLDMFLVGLVMLAAVLGLRADGRAVMQRVPWLLALVVMVPTILTMQNGGPLDLPSKEVSADSLKRLQDFIREAEQGGEVLFIDQRQLFSFGHMPGIPLVLDYELKDLMNQAMAANSEYLERFYNDLRSGRFTAIVVDPMPVEYQGRSHPFGEENDAWVHFVSEPFLASYEPALRLDEVGVWVYEPKP